MNKLEEILQFYVDNYDVSGDIEVVKQELLDNNVEVNGDSFYCPIWNEDNQLWILLAGTKSKADMWVLKKIIKLIKSGDKIVSVLNGNSDYLIKALNRYDVKVINQEGQMSFISFN